MTENTAPCWEIRGLSLPLDLEDADTMERYEDAFAAMSGEERKIQKDGRQSERIRAYCMLYRSLFARIFGEGTAEKLFADVPMSAAAHEEIYLSFLDFARAQTKAAMERRAARLQKYKPASITKSTAKSAAKSVKKK